LLNGDIGVLQRSASETGKGTDGVLEVGNFLCLCGLTEVARLGAETDESGSCAVRDLVCDNIDTTVSSDSLLRNVLVHCRAQG
jgi:hypothetical protein